MARQRLQGLTRVEVEARGWDGPERILVEITEALLAGEGGMRELGLPTTLEIPGEGTPRATTEKECGTLFEEWILRKEGKLLGEVFGRTRRLRLEGDHRLFGKLMSRNVAATKVVWKAGLRKTIVDQAPALRDLQGAPREAAAAGVRRTWRPPVEGTADPEVELLERVRRLQEETRTAPGPRVLNAGARVRG